MLILDLVLCLLLVQSGIRIRYLAEGIGYLTEQGVHKVLVYCTVQTRSMGLILIHSQLLLVTYTFSPNHSNTDSLKTRLTGNRHIGLGIIVS